jgi:hypothetical protein
LLIHTPRQCPYDVIHQGRAHIVDSEETVQHYLLYCVKFAEERERMITNIYKECGVGAVTEELLRSVESDDSFKEHRSEINRILGEFVKGTAHF